MRKTALVVATALMVTLGSSMAFANVEDQNANKEFKAQQKAKYLTVEQNNQLDELVTNYRNSISDLVKEVANMKYEIDYLVDIDIKPERVVYKR